MIILLLVFSLLSSSNYKQREAATKLLTSANYITIKFIEHHELNGQTAEERRRCQLIVNKYYRENAEKISKNIGMMPYINFNLIPNGSDYFNKARIKACLDNESNKMYREATRYLMEEMIASRQNWKKTLCELYELEIREFGWYNLLIGE
jgi:hypothetical protein